MILGENRVKFNQEYRINQRKNILKSILNYYYLIIIIINYILYYDILMAFTILLLEFMNIIQNFC